MGPNAQGRMLRTVLVLGALAWAGPAVAETIILADGQTCLADVTVLAQDERFFEFTVAGGTRRWSLGRSAVMAVTNEPPSGLRPLTPEQAAAVPVPGTSADETTGTTPAGTAVEAAPAAETAPAADGAPAPKPALAPVRREAPDRPMLCFTGLEHLEGLIFLTGRLGMSSLAMQDLNRSLKAQSRYFEYYGLPSQGLVESGTEYAGSVGFWVLENLALGVEVGYLETGSKGGDTRYGQEIGLPVFEIGGTLRGGVTLGQAVYSAGIGVYSFSLSGAKLTNYYAGFGYPNDYWELSGATTAFKGFANAEYLFTPNLGLVLTGGYRAAVIADVRGKVAGFSNIPLTNQDGTRLKLDFSGFYFLVGLGLYFPN